MPARAKALTDAIVPPDDADARMTASRFGKKEFN
jgi:hypothetical protein